MNHCRWIASVGLIAMLFPTAVLESSPMHGQHRDEQIEIDANDTREFLETYRGGQRACVIVAAQTGADVRLKIDVYDAKKELTATTEQSEIAAVVWYPPRDGQYKIRVQNRGAVSAMCSIAWK